MLAGLLLNWFVQYSQPMTTYHSLYVVSTLQTVDNK